ncbi:MAG: hypothetical protein M3Q47_05365 [Actinomycetota bacterium]|nr:hypothetical protein [Actinomycetota bacterium]
MTTIDPAAVDLAQARKQLAEAEERAEAIRRQVEQQQADAAAARARRLEQFDQAALTNLAEREEAVHEEEKQARDEFRAAVLAAPIFSALIRHRAGRWRRTYLRDERVNVMNRIDAPGSRPSALNYYDPRLLEELVQFCEDEARRIAADEMDEYHQRRQAAGNGDSA